MIFPVTNVELGITWWKAPMPRIGHTWCITMSAGGAISAFNRSNFDTLVGDGDMVHALRNVRVAANVPA